MSESDYQTPPFAPSTPLETDDATMASSEPTTGLPNMPSTPIRTRFDVNMADPDDAQGTPTPRSSRRGRHEVCLCNQDD